MSMSTLDLDISKAPGGAFAPETSRVYAYPLVGETVRSRKEMNEYHKLHIYAHETYGSLVSSNTSKYSCANCNGGCSVRYPAGKEKAGRIHKSQPCTCKPRNFTKDWRPGDDCEWKDFDVYPKETVNKRKNEKPGTAGDQKPGNDYQTAITGFILRWINSEYDVQVIRLLPNSPKSGAKRKNQNTDVQTTFVTRNGRVFLCHYTKKTKKKEEDSNSWKWKSCVEITDSLTKTEAASLLSTAPAQAMPSTSEPALSEEQQVTPTRTCSLCYSDDITKLIIVNCPSCMTKDVVKEERLLCNTCLENQCTTRRALPLDAPPAENFAYFYLTLDGTSYGYTCPFDRRLLSQPTHMRFSEYPHGDWNPMARLPNWFIGNRAVFTVVERKVFNDLYNQLIKPFVDEYLKVVEWRDKILATKALKNDEHDANIDLSDTELGVIERALAYFRKESLELPWLAAHEDIIPIEVVTRAHSIKDGKLPKICARTEFFNRFSDDRTVYMEICDRYQSKP